MVSPKMAFAIEKTRNYMATLQPLYELETRAVACSAASSGVKVRASPTMAVAAAAAAARSGTANLLAARGSVMPLADHRSTLESHMPELRRAIGTGFFLFLASTPCFAPPPALPEPGSFWLVGLALGALVYFAKRKK
jgi:hypothetical protein